MRFLELLQLAERHGFEYGWTYDSHVLWHESIPLLALDMYEHSYHIDYGATAAAYVDAFMAAINWPNVAKSFRAASS